MTREQFELPFPQMPRLTHFGYSACVKEYQYGPHYHFGYEFIYITRGTAIVQLFKDKEPVTLCEDDVCIISPQVVHEFKLEDQDISFFWMGFQTGDLVAHTREHMLPPRMLLSRERPAEVWFENIVNEQIDKIASKMTFGEFFCHRKVPSLHPLFSTIYEELGTRDEYSQQIIYQKVLELFTRIARLIHTSGPSDSSPISYIREYLEAHCRQTVDLGELSRKAGYSQEHVSRAFKEHYGISPKHFHDTRRLQEAKSHLKRHGSVKDAAAYCGFSSGSYFSSWFKKVSDLSPQEYIRGSG